MRERLLFCLAFVYAAWAHEISATINFGDTTVPYTVRTTGPVPGSSTLYEFSFTSLANNWICLGFGSTMVNARAICYSAGTSVAPLSQGVYEYKTSAYSTNGVSQVTGSERVYTLVSSTVSGNLRTITFRSALKRGVNHADTQVLSSFRMTAALGGSSETTSGNTYVMDWHGFNRRGDFTIDLSDHETAHPTTATGGGDPHLTTTDGVRYTFNGIGVYRLLYVPEYDFEVQLKTHLAGTRSAAIFGLAFRQGAEHTVAWWNGTQSEHVIVANNHQIVLPPDTIPAAQTYYGHHISAQRSAVDAKGDGTLELFTSLAPGFRLTLKFGRGRSAFWMTTPDEWRGKTTGLVGNGNGDPQDDLRAPDGTVVPLANATMSRIHYEFGTKWAVPEEDDLFHDYSIVWRNEVDKFPTDFVPNFAPEFRSEEFKQAALQLCKGDRSCLYDAASTGSLDYAAVTLEDIASSAQPVIVL